MDCVHLNEIQMYLLSHTLSDVMCKGCFWIVHHSMEFTYNFLFYFLKKARDKIKSNLFFSQMLLTEFELKREISPKNENVHDLLSSHP